MGSIDCYGLSARAGFSIGGKVDVGLCFEDSFPYFYPRVAVGLGANLVGAGLSAYEETITYDSSYSYVAEFVNSWLQINYPGEKGVAFLGSFFSGGSSGSGSEGENVARVDHSIGLFLHAPVVSDEGDNIGAPVMASIDLTALVWNGVSDLAETAAYGVAAAAVYWADGVVIIADETANAAEAAWNGVSGAAEYLCNGTGYIFDSAWQYWETAFN